MSVADGEGFEPPEPLLARLFSKPRTGWRLEAGGPKYTGGYTELRRHRLGDVW
jgi:hypothetical protein